MTKTKQSYSKPRKGKGGGIWLSSFAEDSQRVP